MLNNVFIDQPEFTDNDPRVNRPEVSGVAISKEFLAIKNSILLPPEFIKGKRILDLGSCTAASGAWALSHGADYYKGVEFQKEFAENSKNALAKYYSEKRWDIECSSVEDFFESNNDSFDIVIAAGIMHVFPNPISILKTIAKIADAVIIDGPHPSTFRKTKYLSDNLKNQILNAEEYKNYIENEPFIELGLEGMTVPGEQTFLFHGLRPSMGAIKVTLAKEGFAYIDEPNQRLQKAVPKFYSIHRRYGAFFVKKSNISSGDYGFISASSGTSFSKLYKWEDK